MKEFEYYRVNMANEMCCVVGTTLCMEWQDLQDYARQQGWSLKEVEAKEISDDLQVW